MGDQDPKLTTNETNGTNGDPTATLLNLLGNLLADSATNPAAAGNLLESILHRLTAVNDPLTRAAMSLKLINASALERRPQTMRIPPFGSAYVTDLTQLLKPEQSFDSKGGFKLKTSGVKAPGLFSPALIIPVASTGSNREQDPATANTQPTGEVPTLEYAIMNRTRGMDVTVKPTNRALVELSAAARRFRFETLSHSLSENVFSQICLGLIIKDMWNNNKTDPGGQTLEIPHLDQDRITIEDMFHSLSPDGRQSLQIVAPLLRRWLRMLEVSATAPIALAEGDPFGSDIMSDVSVLELHSDLKKAQKYRSVPLTRDSIRLSRHPLRKYLHYIKPRNIQNWEALIDNPDLLQEAPKQLRELAKIRTVMVMAPTGAGKSTLSDQIVQDRQRLLGENDPNATTRLLYLGSKAIIGISGEMALEEVSADSPFNLLISAIDRAQDPLQRDSAHSLILMEMPPTIRIGMEPNSRTLKGKTINEIAANVANPAHIALRLIHNQTPLHTIQEHDPSVATVSTIALSRLKKGNVEGIVLPMRRTSQSMELISNLENLQKGNSAYTQTRWSREQSLERLYEIFNCLSPDLKTLWWMGTIGDTQVIPISREFQGELTENDTYNDSLAALYYLLSLHNLRIINLLPDKMIFSKNVGQFLEDGTLSYRKLAQKIPPQHPVAVLIEAANHMHDNLHGSATTDASQFLYGLAISLYSLYPDSVNN